MTNIFKKERRPVDFQRDRLASLLLRFSLPCIFSLLISASYNLVDQIFVGNSSLGINGSSAIGIVFSLFIFSQAFSYLVGDGCSAYLAICQGKNDTKKLHKVIGTGIILTLIFSVILAAVYLIWGKPIIKLFGADDSYIDLAYRYLSIMSYFLPTFMLMNMMAPIIRTDGFPIYQVVSMAVGAILNIIFDAIFVIGCNFGVEGAAWASVIGQVVTTGFIIFYLFISKHFRVKKSSFIPSFKDMKEPLKLGVSSFIAQFSIVIVSLVSNIVLVKYGDLSIYGSKNAISACLAQTKIFTIVIDIIIGLAFGAQPVIGYNIGAGNLFKVKKVYWTLIVITVLISSVAFLLAEICPQVLFAPFGGLDDELYVKCASECFRIFLATIIISCIVKVNATFFQSCGKAVAATFVSMFRDVILFVLCLIFMPMIFEAVKPKTGIYGVFYSAVVTDVISILVSVVVLIKVFQSLSLDYSDPTRKDCTILPSKPGPIFAISREHGSLGKKVAKELSTRLGIPYYYKDIVFLAAKESGLSSSYIYHSFWNNRNSLLSSSYIRFNVDSMAFEAEEKVLNEVADQGSCVILERGASFYLKDRPNLVNIFIYANEEVKIKNVMKKNSMSKKDAIKNIKKINSRRSKYYENISHLPWGKKENYNLTIDASDGNVDRCVNEIIEYIGKAGRN